MKPHPRPPDEYRYSNIGRNGLLRAGPEGVVTVSYFHPFRGRRTIVLQRREEERPGGRRGLAGAGQAQADAQAASAQGKLQLVHNTQPTVANLFEAYDEASSTLERLRTQSEASSAMLEEYLRICDDIESDVIRLCLEHDNPSH
ncbi:hypothetical protein C241_14873 [Bradyrhizobium lupini HPC(L)]|uniref:Uncharacterized protein n=1 Tax=Bradyrhizobium lupini HPC(L) TaxID=1229491 RepID=A0ABP2RPY4_RHILU|nr:hypothetical protein C241_14873 [Bradyrhizobium lupini HPC(L)]